MLRENWAESFGKDEELWKLKESGKAALFYTKSKANNDPFVHAPIYHVWLGDRWLYTGTSRMKAEMEFNEAMRHAHLSSSGGYPEEDPV